MAYVVTEPCINCKHTDCVEVCPVECFHEGANMLVINPDVCIDCGLCIPECPVSAIYDEDDLPPEYGEYKELNARFSMSWPRIRKSKPPLPTAAKFKDVKKKRGLLDPIPFSGK
jgi:ferredoxin